MKRIHDREQTNPFTFTTTATTNAVPPWLAGSPLLYGKPSFGTYELSALEEAERDDLQLERFLLGLTKFS